MSTDFDYSNNTPLTASLTGYNAFRSGYKNMRFAFAPTKTYVIDASDMSNLVGIAFREYGDVSMWYPLMAFNGIQDVVQEVYPGLVLKLPNKSDVIAYSSAAKKNQTPTFEI